VSLFVDPRDSSKAYLASEVKAAPFKFLLFIILLMIPPMLIYRAS